VPEIGVSGTLRSAAAGDYRITAVTDGVASPSPELQEACFEIWRRKVSRLRTTDEIAGEPLPVAVRRPGVPNSPIVRSVVTSVQAKGERIMISVVQDRSGAGPMFASETGP
jgi:hypothetical protein